MWNCSRLGHVDNVWNRSDFEESHASERKACATGCATRLNIVRNRSELLATMSSRRVVSRSGMTRDSSAPGDFIWGGWSTMVECFAPTHTCNTSTYQVKGIMMYNGLGLGFGLQAQS